MCVHAHAELGGGALDELGVAALGDQFGHVRAIGKALVEGEPSGFCKVVADAETGLVLGMHAIGPHVTELIAEGCYAKLVEGTANELGMSVHAHPTLAEIVGEAARAVTGQAINF
jgi:dihydrolipoyl dehydrogenase